MSPAASLDALRDRIRQIERPARHGVLPFGVAAIDRALPGGGLMLGALHEILGAGGDEEDGAAAAGFVAGILARLDLETGLIRGLRASPIIVMPGREPGIHAQPANCLPLSVDGRVKPGHDEKGGWVDTSKTRSGPILWCLRRPDLYGPGLTVHGLDPARLVLVAAPRDDDVLGAMEEGLRAGAAAGLAAVVGEVGRLPMVAGRRLQLAAERAGVAAFLLRRWRNAAEAAAERERPSAAATRWRIAALPSADIAGLPGIGRPRWRIELLRCRGGAPGAWDVEVADAAGHVSPSAGLADRPAAPQRRDPEPRRRAG